MKTFASYMNVSIYPFLIERNILRNWIFIAVVHTQTKDTGVSSWYISSSASRNVVIKTKSDFPVISMLGF